MSRPSKASDASYVLFIHAALHSSHRVSLQVEVKVDKGPWRAAALAGEPRAQFSWTFFSIDLGNLKPGKHALVSRAIDVNARSQPTTEDNEISLKKTYWEAHQQWPRQIELEV